MDTKQIHELLKKICIKLRNDNVGNLEIAYIEGADPRKDPTVMSVIFITFEDMNPIGTEKYFKLAFQSDAFELRPTINNPLADPMLLGLELYGKVKDYYLQWRKQQSAGALWASQSKAARTYAREDAKQTATLAKLAALEDAFADTSGAYTKSEVDKAIGKASGSSRLGTAKSHASPWEDPLKAEQTAEHISKQYTYMMQRRVELLLRAISVLEAKKEIHFTDKFFKESDSHIYGTINCRLTLELDSLPPVVKFKYLDFDIPDRMFDHTRHTIDNSVHIPADETQLSEGHLILRLAYILFKAAQLGKNERITNEIIRTKMIDLQERFDF